MQPYARGVYVNYLGVGDDTDRVRAAYGPARSTPPVWPR